MDGPAHELTAVWTTRWPGMSGLVQFDGIREHPHWIRFHSLPESKRYSDTAEEAEVVLSRHRELLRALGLTGECFAVSTWWSGPGEVNESPGRAIAERHPGSSVWRHGMPDEDSGAWATLRVSAEQFPSVSLDRFLARVVDEEIIGAAVLPPTAEWIYHPYDGGADVVPRSHAEREALATRFAGWLPKTESGR